MESFSLCEGGEGSLAFKGCKTIAEYAIRKWMNEQNFAVECFSLTMDGNEGVLEDQQGETLTLIYNPGDKSVNVKE